MSDGSHDERAPEPSRPVTPRTGTPRPKQDGVPDPTPRSTSKSAGRPRSPNYAARRMLITTVGITAVVAAGVGVWRFTNNEPAGAEDETTAWSEVVFVDRGTGAVGAVAPDEPAVVAAQAVGTGRATEVYAEGDRLALVQAGQVTLTGLGEAAPTVIPIDRDAVVTRLPIDGALWLAIGSAPGGNVLLIDGTTGATYDVGALSGQSSPRYFVDTMRHDVVGRAFAVADAVNGQTIVVDPTGQPPTAAFFADIPVAVAPERVVTSQVIGQQADLTLLDPERKVLAKVSGELPAGGLIVDGDVTIVSTEGTITRFGEGDEEAERVGSVAVPAGGQIASVSPTAGNTRMVVFGSTFEALIDLEGRTLFTTAFPAPVERPSVDPGWSCLPVGGGETFTTIVDTESGEQLVDLRGVTVQGIAADGCTVLGTRAGVHEVIGVEGTVQLGQVRAATLAPDGRAVVLQTTAGTTQLVRIDGDTLADPIDLTPVAGSNPLITFR
jgi:hypothetical protein